MVDSRVNDSNLFVTSTLPSVSSSEYNYNRDSYEYIKELIPSGVFDSIAIVAHADFGPKVSFLENEDPFIIDKKIDPEFSSLTSFIQFLQEIKQKTNIKYIDFLGCALASSPMWIDVFNYIQTSIPDLIVRASTDNTGNIVSDNWILELGGVDAKALYFTDSILDYIGSLVAITSVPINTASTTGIIPITTINSTTDASRNTWVQTYTSTTTNYLSNVASSSTPTINNTIWSRVNVIKYGSFTAPRNAFCIYLSPAIDYTSDIHKLSFYFSHDRGNSAFSDKLEIYLLDASTVPTNYTSLGTPVASYTRYLSTANSSSTMTLKELIIPNTYSKYYIAFKFISNAGNNMYVDDISLNTLASVDSIASGPTINSITYSGTTGILQINANQPVNNTIGISRYYAQYSTSSDFSNPINIDYIINIGYVINNAIGNISLTYSNQYFTNSTIYLRLIAASGYTLGNIPGISNTFNVYKTGDQYAATVNTITSASTPSITSVSINSNNGVDIVVQQTSLGNPTISRYYIQYSYNSDFSSSMYKIINGTPSIGSNSFTISPLFINTQIYIKVTAYNGVNGAASLPISSTSLNFYNTSSTSITTLSSNIFNNLIMSINNTNSITNVTTQLSGYKLFPYQSDIITQSIDGTNYLIPINAKNWTYNAGQKVVSVASGYHSVLLLADRSVRTFGFGMYGQLGNNTTTNSSTPVSVSNISNAVAIAKGAFHTVVLLADGSVKTFGLNIDGQLGNGTKNNSSIPVTVSGISNAIAIAGGYSHTAILLADGSIKTFGFNGTGQLGNGTTTNSSTPVSVTGISNAIGVACGINYTAVLLADGSVKTFGANNYGQLGNSTTINSSIPVTVSGISNAIGVACNSVHTVVLLADGSVKTFGWNSDGQLGNGTTTNSSIPVTVSNITNAIGISCGSNHTNVLLADGSIKSFGLNNYGQLGNGTTTSSSTLVSVSNITNAIAVSSGDYNTIALLADGSVKSFGANNRGQLGNGITNDSSTPVSITGIQYIPTSSLPFKKYSVQTSVQRLNTSITTVNMYDGFPCLLGHTKVLTPTGLRKISELNTDDNIITSTGKTVPIKMYSSALIATKETAPYKFKANSITKGYPIASFEISPTHAIAAPGGWIIPKYAHLSGIKAKQTRIGEEITYYHIELPNYLNDNLVLDSGVVVESFGISWLNTQPKNTVVYKFNHATKLFERPAYKQSHKSLTYI